MTKISSRTKQGKFDRRVHLRPDPSNRQEAVDRIVWGLQGRGVLQSRIETDVRYIREFLEGAPSGKAGIFTPEVSMFGLSFEHVMRGTLRCLEHDVGGWDEIALGLNYSRFGMSVDRARREANGAAFSDPCRLGDTPAFLWLLSLACVDRGLLKPWSHYLYNLVSTRGLEDDFRDGPMFSFLWLILRAECEGVWPSSSEIGDELEALGPLLAKVSNPLSFAGALEAFLDYRLSRSYLFANRTAQKAESDGDFLFWRQWMAILPAELLGLRVVCKRLLGIELDLNVDHPLVQTPMLKPPIFEDLPTDPLLDEIVTACGPYFRDLWRPEHVVRLIQRD